MNIIEVAKKYLGVVEGSPEHKHIIDVYNSQKVLPNGYKVTYKDPWCAAFVTACAIEAKCLQNVFPSCNCYDMQTWYKYNQRFTKVYKRANIGDYVLYDWDGDGYSDHVGILISRDGDTLKVIEGNKSDKVDIRTIKGTDSNIYGFCKNRLSIQQYDVDSHTNKTKLDNLDAVAMSVIAGKYGNGKERINNLKANGYDYYKVQERVNTLYDKMYNPKHS